MEEKKLDIKDFPSLSSAPDTCHILLVQQTGSAGKLTIGLFKTMVKRALLPSIKDGVWWVGEVDTKVDAVGKSPIFRKGATGIEWKYATAPDEAWAVAAPYDSIKLKYDDLTEEQRADLISLDNMTPAEIARLQQPANDMILILTRTNETATTAEASRVEKENTRVAEESKRASEESKRDAAERLRAQEETLRKQKEEARVTEESNRQFKETGRVKEETARNQKETSRQSGEETRVAREKERDIAELARVATENACKEAENTRVAEENIRKAAETSRTEEHERVITQTNEAKNQAIQAAKDVDEATQKALAAADQADTARDQATDATEQAISASDSVEEAKNQAVQAAGKAEESATKADEATVRTNTARDQAAAAALAAKEIAEHQPYIGEDYYFYQWNLATKAYDKTNIYTKGEGFSIFRSYTSVALMRADKAHVPEGRFVMINTGDVENPDNAQVYFRNSSAVEGFDFVVDMSGAIGFTGKTPQFVMGNITTGSEGTPVSVSLSENGTDQGGNPVYAINLSIPRGDKGKVPVIAMGEVTTIAPDSPASAVLTPDGAEPDGTPKYKLNLSIPKGEQGSLAVGDAKDLTVTYAEAAERANIQSGETISTLFGKIRKFFSDLKTVAFTGKFSDLEGKPTTVDGYGITDATKKEHKHNKADISDFPTSMPASDVPGWAKADKKPTYTASEVGASPSNHDHAGTYEPKFEKNNAFNKAFGKDKGTVCEGDDSRLADARNPLAHKHNKADISDFPTSMPASDVPGWAKQPTKPAYSAGEVGASPANHDHGQTYQPKGSYASLDHNHNGAYEPKFEKNNAFNKAFGKVKGTVCEGDDSRLSDARPANGGTSQVANQLKLSGTPSSFNWSGQGGQPTWLLGGSDPSNIYVYNPSNFHVNKATYGNRLVPYGYADNQYDIISRFNEFGDGRFRLVVEGTDDAKNYHNRLAVGWADTAGSAPASDVHPWAKQPTKPAYTAGEVGALGTDHNASVTAHQDIRNLIVSYLGNAKGYTDTKIAALIGSAPEILDTLGELAEAIVNNKTAVEAINNAIAQKLGKTEAGQLYVALQGYVAFSQSEKNKLATVQQNANYFADAPNDGKEYARKNNKWEITSGGGADSLPVNTILETPVLAGNVFGEKWLKCDGSVIEQEDYPELVRINVFKGISDKVILKGYLSAVTYGDGLFVAVGGNNCYTSPDGINWTSRSGISGSVSAITYGEGLFVVVGWSGSCTSPDGINWTSRNIISGSVYAVTYGDGLFVAVGSRIIYTSPDGINWTSRNIISGSVILNAITYANGLFVAVGDDTCCTSPDGINWTSRSGISGYAFSITYGDGLFVVGGNSTIRTSPDGINWTGLSIGVISGKAYSITYGDGLFVASAGPGIYTSPDGINWTSRGAISSTGDAITYANGLFVAVGTDFCQAITTDKSLPNIKNSYIKVLK